MAIFVLPVRFYHVACDLNNCVEIKGPTLNIITSLVHQILLCSVSIFLPLRLQKRLNIVRHQDSLETGFVTLSKIA